MYENIFFTEVIDQCGFYSMQIRLYTRSYLGTDLEDRDSDPALHEPWIEKSEVLEI